MMLVQATEPKVVRDFPHKVRELEHVWVPMSDGTRLSARRCPFGRLFRIRRMHCGG